MSFAPIKTITPRTRKISPLYADFHKDLTVNPFSNDIALKTDEEAIKEALKNLIFMDKGEKLFQPYFGGNIRAMLFELNSPATIKIIQEQIKTTINNYEPRAELIGVEVYSIIDDNKVSVKILYALRSREDPIEVEFILERVR
jgi:phage baseplate assembly protein W